MSGLPIAKDHNWTVSVTVVGLLVSESAPFTCHWGVLVSPVELNVLHGVTQAELVDAGAASNVALHHDNRQIVDQFLRVCQMGVHGFLVGTLIIVLIFKSVGAQSEGAHGRGRHHAGT